MFSNIFTHDYFFFLYFCIRKTKKGTSGHKSTYQRDNSKMKMKHIIAPILLLLASACSNERGGLVFSDEERDSKDAILSKVLSVDSLNDMLLDYEEQKDELGQIVAYRYLGIRYREENQVSTALNRHQHGLAHANEMSDTIEMVSAHNQIAINYLHMGQLENAAQHLLNSLALCTQYKDRYNK